MMTIHEKQEIQRLQKLGYGYRKIAAETGLSVNAVKSYCARHPVMVEQNVCLQCGMPLKQRAHKKKPKFCSDQCRSIWWNANRDRCQSETYSYICPQCGLPFKSHKRNRLYCSRKCYADARRKVVGL